MEIGAEEGAEEHALVAGIEGMVVGIADGKLELVEVT